MNALAARIERIESRGDPRIADYCDIREADLVRERGLFIAEGTEVVRTMMARSRFVPRSVLIAERHLPLLGPDLERTPTTTRILVAAQPVLDEIAGFHIHRGCLAAGDRRAMPSTEDVLAGLADAPSKSGQELVLVLEALANHDNVGSLFRNAAAFGVRAVFLDPRCADPLYRKSIRVSLGAALTIPFARLEPWPDALGELSKRGFETLALTPRSSAEDLASLFRSPAKVPRRAAILVGTEGTGLSDVAFERADRSLRIPMADQVDSINVATAAAIALFTLSNSRT